MLRTDARIIAASNVDLERATREGRFREDLYFRLNVVGIHVPPLRERPEDIVALTNHFLRELSETLGRPSTGLQAGVLDRILEHPWRGNVRELRNALEKAVLLSDPGPIDASHLSLSPQRRGPDGATWEFTLPEKGIDLRAAERGLLVAALERTGFVQKEAARLLCVTPRKLNYMIQRLGVTHPSWRRNSQPANLPQSEPSRFGVEEVPDVEEGAGSSSDG
jgi:transcriptional regulator with GAF, ATPase, and Fis domain